jgi:hypothetical protein
MVDGDAGVGGKNTGSKVAGSKASGSRVGSQDGSKAAGSQAGAKAGAQLAGWVSPVGSMMGSMKAESVKAGSNPAAGDDANEPDVSNSKPKSIPKPKLTKGGGGGGDKAVGLYKFIPVHPYSLKAPGFNPRT